MARMVFETQKITDWKSFHRYSAFILGFEGWYGENMDAWIDCMSCLFFDEGLTQLKLQPGEKLELEVLDSENFRKRVPEVFAEFTGCIAAVNRRFRERKASNEISVIFS